MLSSHASDLYRIMPETICIVDEDVCHRIAERLCLLQIPDPVEPFAATDATDDFDKATCNLALVAICHQTQRLSGIVGGQRRRGWDHLQTSFLTWAQSGQSEVNAEWLVSFEANSLALIIDEEQLLPQSDIFHRAELIRDCGRIMLERGYSTASDLFKRCDQTISVGTPNLLDELSQMRAYDDPVRKKSLYLLGLNQTTCGWTYRDPKSLLPPVDYHEVRGHLRLGSVRISDETLRHLIKHRHQVKASDDVAVRRAVAEAIRLIAAITGFTPMQLHYTFWNLFRNVCLRSQPRCGSADRSSLPSEYQHLIVERTCPFASFCGSAFAENAIDEYTFVTDWY